MERLTKILRQILNRVLKRQWLMKLAQQSKFGTDF